jgi:histidinol-phosphate aminotransferase
MSEPLSRRRFNLLLGAAGALSAMPALAQSPRAAILLNSNENPYGPSPAAMRAVREALPSVFRYPDDAESELTAAIAQLHGLSTSEILLGNGSSDILRLAASAFRGKLVTATPTFESLWSHARGQEIVRVPLDAAHAHDLETMLRAAGDAKLVYICNPNNPTATITPKGKIRAFLSSLPASAIVMVDEAYHHYAESADYESCVPLIRSHANLVVVRTFSKIYAMAGLRCGHALAQRPVIAQLAAEQAYNAMNLLACVAATASLKDADYAVRSRRRNHEIRASVVEQLSKLGYQTLPSHANFVMIDMRRDVRPAIAEFRNQGIRVGRLFPAMPQHLRVTVGTEEEMRRFVDVFRATQRG